MFNKLFNILVNIDIFSSKIIIQDMKKYNITYKSWWHTE